VPARRRRYDFFSRPRRTRREMWQMTN